jgi:ATP-dependent RNA helicase DHX29
LCDSGLLQGASRFLEPSKSRIRFLQIPEKFNAGASDPRLVMACVAAGMYPKLLVSDPSGQFRTLLNNAPASIHPSSVNFTPGRRPDFGDTRYVSYFNIQQTKKLYVWECGAVDELAIYLLCGEQDVKLAAQSLSIDRKIKVRTTAKSALALNLLRSRYQRLFDLKMKHPARALEGTDAEWWNLLLEALSTEKEEAQEQPEQPKVAMIIH